MLIPKTIPKWRKQTTTLKQVRCPKLFSTILASADEAAFVWFHQQALLSIDDYLFTYLNSIPSQSRSALHHCWQRHILIRSPPHEEGTEVKKRRLGNVPLAICTSICRAVNRRSQAVLTVDHKPHQQASLYQVVPLG